MNYPIHDEVSRSGVQGQTKLSQLLDRFSALNDNLREVNDTLESRTTFILRESDAPAAPNDDRRGGDSGFDRSMQELLDQYERNIQRLKDLVYRLDV